MQGKALIDADIAEIAKQLNRLRDAGVPVLWRPLHEASGGWFWWGAKGPEAYKKLWYYLYDQLTNVYGCNNLIWVWNGQNPDWYPGDNAQSICTIAHGIEVITAELRITAANDSFISGKPNHRKKAYRLSVGTLSLLLVISSVLQGSHSVFFLELTHEVVLVFVAALLSNLLNTQISVSKELHCTTHA